MSTDQSNERGTGPSGSPLVGRGDADRTAAITRSLLGYGVIVGPFYVVVGLAQALTREGFDLTRHDLSLLANGPLGWIQIANLVLSGLMVIAAAVGMRRALRVLGGGPGSVWGPRLVAGYGIGMVGAGVFVADPMNGFPPGTRDDGPEAPSIAGLGHLLFGGLGFLALVVGCFVLARAYRDRTGLAWFSRITGVLFLVGFAGIATGSATPVVVLGFWVALIVAWTWLALVSLDLYRRTPLLTPAS
ncbi:hypothetical protein Acsp06_52380 [Actinomycetospora sp. NBRC 106375]|uniref:DUF998 domain-containing protein n=1 Tax=Actinomycetospora sp. NBRC 106375 TaxID=3032207 RepID=UPI0024A3514A|nr:DUF998 domain-containing protein [Actinomycetospora sp. NBRC 106375]GLZ49053.1 hypothetical protein Acsp06_52380 [Actinomycetospora sp. NBRC 106375]